jgi:DNA polymerase III alpha subunit
MFYQNYHKHDYYSNVIVPDSPVSPEDYAKRAVELGHSILSSVQHGWQGRYIEHYELAKKYNLKYLFGTEAYIVKDRLEKDSTNAHIILLAKNENGRTNINRILSEASLSGFYYRPRIDLELLFSLPANDIWVTSACVGGLWKYQDADELILKVSNYFQDNFFLEVQNHNTDSQKRLNTHILELSKQHNIKIIFGCDSHFILPEQSKDRDDYLLSKHIVYEDESGWYMDYPDNEEAERRFVEQGVLSEIEIQDAMNNTNILLEVEEYDSPVFNKNLKLPSIYPDNTQNEKNQILTDIIWGSWNIEKIQIPKNQWAKYEKEILKELNIVLETNMSDYFLLDYEVVKKGKELGGHITMTGRGSAPSFYISKLLGFTTIDRIASPVKLFPERFITKERILEAGTIPDIDFNIGNPEVFAQAQIEVLGENHSYPMLAYGTLHPKAAWKMYARARNVDFDTANIVSEQIEKYEFTLKHTEEEEKENVDVLDFIEKDYQSLYSESKKYLGIVSDFKIHPCAFILYMENIKEEIGIIKIKENICSIMDGLWAENYKFLKNDLLRVMVVDLIYRVYNRINQKPHPLPELVSICNQNKDVWDIYKNGYTIGINQVEQPSTKTRVSKYAPQNISELSALISAIRPGFKSNYAQFESREPFSYGIPSLDNIIQTEEFPQSYMLYQENAMQVMAYAGISISTTYEIVKNIAKKRYEKVLKYKEKFLEGMTKKIIKQENKGKEDAEIIAHKTWQIIEDSAFYQFNAAHAYSVAGDSLYGAYLKSHYPLFFYETFLQMMEEDGDKDRLLLAKLEAGKAFGIKFPKAQFGQDNRKIVANPDTNEITTSLKSIKGFGSKTAEDMYYLSSIYQGNDFLELLLVAEDNGMVSSKFEQLIKLGYFDQFGGNKKLHKFYLEFTKGKNRYNKTLTQKSKDKRLPELQTTFAFMDNEKFSIQEQIQNELEIVNGVQSKFGVDVKYLCVLEIDEKYAPMILVQVLKSGLQEKLKVSKKNLREHPFNIGDVLICKEISHPFGKKKNTEGEWVDNPEKKYIQLDCYYVMRPEDEFYKDIKHKILYDQFAN